MTVDTLERKKSTRNEWLVRLLEDHKLVEDRGTGIRAMMRALRSANLQPPGFDDQRTSFTVTFWNRTFMTPAAIAWLNQFAADPINDRQRSALVYLRVRQRITNADYRRLNNVDPTVAGKELRHLVQASLLRSLGVARWTQYELAVPAHLDRTGLIPEEVAILAYIDEHGSITNQQARGAFGLTRDQSTRFLTQLRDRGFLRATGTGRWTVYLLQELP